MSKETLINLMEFVRGRTLITLDTIAKEADCAKILGWRPGPGRAHIAWQFMHVGATDDKHLNKLMKGGEAKNPENLARFAGGSTPDENIPTVEEIKAYLLENRQALLEHLRSLDESQLPTKPTPDAKLNYQDWFTLLSWHESHHQGQAHLTLNLYKNQ